MFLLILFISFLLGTTSLPPPAKYCVNCQFFLLKNNNPLNSNLENNPHFGKCSLFPKIEKDDTNNNKTNILVVGEEKIDNLDFQYCSTARSFNDMCGTSGRFYKEKKISKKQKCFNKFRKMYKDYFDSDYE